MATGEQPGLGAEGNQEFTLPNVDAVREENWAELEAQGVTVVDGNVPEGSLLLHVRIAQRNFGTENVLTGDAFDDQEHRPLRHKPGRGIYRRPSDLADLDDGSLDP